MKNRLLFISQMQFGYLIDYYQYCKFLKTEYDLTYLCWDYDRDKVVESGVRIIYIPRKGNVIYRNIFFIIIILRTVYKEKFKIIFTHYFRGVFLLSPMRIWNKNIHLDIRTGKIDPNLLKKEFYNKLILFESLFFKSKSIISLGLQKQLGIKGAKIIPLGANEVNVKDRIYDIPRLLYVGVLNDRNLEHTIEGLSKFKNKNPNLKWEYLIIGDGWGDIKNILKNKINNCNLQDNIKMLGYIPHEDLKYYLEKSSIGISYIPITKYYKYQPATKTYEYLMAGMPVIATNTFANSQIINERNGVLINDSPQGFEKGISEIIKKLHLYDIVEIKKSVADHDWKKIVENLRANLLS